MVHPLTGGNEKVYYLNNYGEIYQIRVLQKYNNWTDSYWSTLGYYL